MGMSRLRSHLPLPAGLGLSLVLHAAVLLPGLVMILTSPSKGRAQLDPDLPQESPREQTEPARDVPLGIDAPTPSTLTWIGYEDYQEHLATLSEQEQAAFTMHPASVGAPPSAPALPAPATAETPAEESETALADTGDGEAAGAPEARAPSLPIPLETIGGLPAANTPPEAIMGPPAPSFGGLDEARPARLQPGVEGPPAPASHRARTEETRAADAARPVTPPRVPPAPRAVARPAPPARDAETTEPDEGDPADKESPATSTVDVPLKDLKLGKPLAAQGLELKPRRPDFTTLTLLTASPGNPLVEVRFRRSGKPSLARIIDPSGDRRVDDALTSSLYRWRAAGPPLEALTGSATIDVRIRVILNPRAAASSD